ncbi:MAG: 2-phospho-L-lactate guanylyltransferase [Actinomycetales bacterium]|nr:2-phospho-L-lactate guanylyltransferase [Actinomycetales bacterium]
MRLTPRARWRVVVPVKPTHGAKSRLHADPELARAIALDTLHALAQARSVAEIVVVTADRTLGRELPVRARIAREPAPSGIAAALERGLRGRRPETPVAALLGDLPALRGSEIAAALAIALELPGAFVPDADGTGTTLVTAAAGSELRPRFGPDSAAAHRTEGLVEIPVSVRSGLRRDVDLPDHLVALGRALGPRTRAVLAQAADEESLDRDAVG